MDDDEQKMTLRVAQALKLLQGQGHDRVIKKTQLIRYIKFKGTRHEQKTKICCALINFTVRNITDAVHKFSTRAQIK